MEKQTILKNADLPQGYYDFENVKKEDIRVNACIFFYNEEEGIMIPMVVDEVINLDDQFKAFSANGCRYGLDGFYRMKYY